MEEEGEIVVGSSSQVSGPLTSGPHVGSLT